MGNADRVIRLLLAAVLVILYFTHTVTGTFGVLLLIFAGVMAMTSLIRFCPLYTLCGVNTCPIKSKS